MKHFCSPVRLKRDLWNRYLQLFIAFGFLLSFSHNAYSAYMKNVPTEVKQPDGTVLNCFASGSEYHNWLHDKNNYTIIKDVATQYFVYAVLVDGKLSPSKHIAGKSDPVALGLTKGVNLSKEEVDAHIASRKASRPVPVKSNKRLDGPVPVRPAFGLYNNLVIFISFSDQTEISQPLADIKAKFNGLGHIAVRDFYKEVSNSQLDLVSTFFPTTTGTYPVSYRDSHPRTYYQKDTPDGYTNTLPDAATREHTLLANAVKAVASQVPASLVIDGDNDGNIDNITFIINGSVEGWSDLLWPHRWSLPSSYNATINGKLANDYLNVYSNSLGIGVISHELFHSLGAPDLYKYNSATYDPTGDWDLMGNGDWEVPRHMTAYMKQRYANWTTSIPVITNPGRYTLQPLSRSPFAAYRINLPNTNQYLVLEYRKKEGKYESTLTGEEGLLIYRINPDIQGNQDALDELYVFRPDGANYNFGSLYQASFSANSQRTRFDDFTNPNCFLTDGSVGGLGSLGITNVSFAGDVISFDYKQDAETPLAHYPLNGNANTLSGTNNGTSNGNTWVTGKYGQGANFDGNDFISLPKTLLNSRTGSVSLWLKTAQTAQSILFYGSSGTSGDGFGSENELHLSLETTGKIKFFIEGGSSDINLTSTGVVNNNAWHHIVATWDINGQAKLYVDNVLSTSATHDAKDFNLSGNLYLGRPNSSTKYFVGQQDQVLLYSQPITPVTINKLYSNSIYAPVAVNNTFSTNEDVVLNTTSVLANDTDLDGEALSIDSYGNPANGTLVYNNNGTFKYTPNKDFSGSDAFSYFAKDAAGNVSNQGTVNITVVPVNDAPIPTPEYFNASKTFPLEIADFKYNDLDADHDQLTVVSFTQPKKGTVVSSNNNELLTYTAQAGYYGKDSLTYTVSDGTVSAVGKIYITVVNNNPPVAVDDYVSGYGYPNILRINDVFANDSDADGQPLSFAGVEESPYGYVDFDGDSKYIYFEPNEGFIGTANVGYYIKDTYGATAKAYARFTVIGNRAPVVADDNISGAGFPNNLRISNVFANDSDPDGDPLTLFNVADPVNGTIDYDGDASYASFYPNEGFVGTEVVEYTVTDGKGAYTTGFLRYTVTSSKHSPVVTTPIPDQTLVLGGGNKTINLNSHFSDADGDVLVFSSSSSYTGIAISGSTLTLSPIATGTYSITIIARDAINLSIGDVFNLTVNNTTVSSDICVEAETALGQSAFSPYQVYTSAAASGGSYISVPNGVGNQSSPPTTSIANMNFNVATAGTYNIWLRVISPTTSDNDLFIRVDNASFSSLTAGPFTSWTWKIWSSKSLTVGAHIISIARKEDGLQIDKVLLTTSSATPTGLGCGASAMAREGEVEEYTSESAVASLEIAPNPTSGIVRVQLNTALASDANIEIYNSYGMKVAEYPTNGNTTMEVDASHFSDGVYFVHYHNGSTRLSKTLVVRK